MFYVKLFALGRKQRLIPASWGRLPLPASGPCSVRLPGALCRSLSTGPAASEPMSKTLTYFPIHLRCYHLRGVLLTPAPLLKRIRESPTVGFPELLASVFRGEMITSQVSWVPVDLYFVNLVELKHY